MPHPDISAEEIGFALRQAEGGIPVEAVAASLSVDPETVFEWKRRYSQLFHSLVLEHQSTGVCLFCGECGATVGTELRECKIRHSFVQDVAATVRQLLESGKKMGFYHGPLPFDVSQFGAPTLLIEDADITIRAVVSPDAGGQRIQTSAEIQRVNQPYPDSESASLILSVAVCGSAQVSCEGRQKPHSLHEVVSSLYYRDVDEGDRVLISDESFIVGMLAIARNPVDAFRTFYTSDLDVMLMGNYLLEK